MNLAPHLFSDGEHEQIIEPLRTIPTSEDVQVVFDDARAVVCSWRRPHASCFLDVSPVQSCRVQFVKVVQVVPAISSTEHVDFVLVAVRSVHVARSRWLTCKFIVEPLKLLQVQDMHVISGKWSLAEPTPNDIQTILDQSCSMPVPALRWLTTWFDWLQPAVFFCVKNSQVAMVFLAIISTKYVEFVIKQSRCMIFNLWSRNNSLLLFT